MEPGGRVVAIPYSIEIRSTAYLSQSVVCEWLLMGHIIVSIGYRKKQGRVSHTMLILLYSRSHTLQWESRRCVLSMMSMRQQTQQTNERSCEKREMNKGDEIH